MSAYSKADLLSIELKERSLFENIIHNFKKVQRVFINIEVPMSIYERSKVFCADIREESGMQFDEITLLNLLYTDFLAAVRRNQELSKWYYLLRDAEKLVKPLTVHHFRDGSSRSNTRFYNNKMSFKRPHFKTLGLFMKYDDLLRGEWFLYDLDMFFEGHGFTVEKLISILYCDFIYKHQRGETKKAVANIIEFMSN